MAASIFVPQEVAYRKLPIGRMGVIALSGFGIKVTVQSGHLELEDGIGPNRRKMRLARVGHRLKRLVCIGSDGFVSLAALRWLADQDVGFSMLERDGKVLAVTGPVRPSDAKLRRAQALALSNGTALRMARELILQKLAAQEQVARRKLLDSITADTIAQFAAELPCAETIASVRLIESQAARCYWSAFGTLPVNFPKKELRRTPEHWLRFGARVSPLTGSPRLAANPANAILNLLYSILESEARLAAAAMGLDPGLGFLHVDTAARDSLASDLMEPARARVDAYFLDWITREPLKREWFYELGNGNCRLSSAFAAQLCETAPIWGRAVAPIAEWAAREFWKTIRKPDAPVATRLTQSNKREAKGRHTVLKLDLPRADRLCRGCGKKLNGRDRSHCADCFAPITRRNFNRGRKLAQRLDSLAKRSATQTSHKQAIRNWNPANLPAWLTRDAFIKQVQPALARVSKSRVRALLRVSEPYASDIQSGKCVPHPRHWQTLAMLTGFQEN